MNVTEWRKFEKLKEENEKLKTGLEQLKQEINIQKEILNGYYDDLKITFNEN
ncbi:hypothetical protein [Spiroplasma endosymbiont of Agriotes lineatus]|uniref:hypothetical protein n=1 Tax=Spiroplasma endosymbiont of Agriotes lineatus TaxID=3077930 RepID=UPI0030D5DCBB